MTSKNHNPHIRPLEQALAARFGWQTGAVWRDQLLDAIGKKARRLGLDEMSYCRMSVASPAELETLAEFICNSETRFFREPEQYDALRAVVIPRLAQLRARERRIDVWSAACSTGEEAYSLGIILQEALPPAEHWKVNLVATDLRGSAIISASRGRYPQSAIRMIEPHIRDKYFVKADANERERLYDVAPPLRNMVLFRRANIYDGGFWKNLTTRFDLVVCNNLLLYFHALAASQTVERFANALKPGGVLVVMKNEAGYVTHPKLRLDTRLPGAFFERTDRPQA